MAAAPIHAPRPGRSRKWVLLGATGASVVAAVLIILLVLLPSLQQPVAQQGKDTQGGTTAGSGTLLHCGAGFPTPNSSWICLNATAETTTGYARGWYQYESNYSYASSALGYRNYTGIGSLQLESGFASASGYCNSGDQGFVRVYVFWHVWVYDVSQSDYVDQADSGYFWDSGLAFCPFAGGSIPPVSSPALVETITNRTLFHGTTGFVAGHVYRFTFFMGCTAEVSLNATLSSSHLSAGCNLHSQHPESNSFTETGIRFV